MAPSTTSANASETVAAAKRTYTTKHGTTAKKRFLATTDEVID